MPLNRLFIIESTWIFSFFRYKHKPCSFPLFCNLVRHQSSSQGQILKEGQAQFFQSNNEVFYNPVQETNRDLSIAVINRYKLLLNSEKQTDNFTILEALSATGLRSIRYFKEIQGVTKIYANDIDASSVQAIRRNIELNGISTESIVPNHADACLFMMQNRDKDSRFDVVDLDPYGSASIFLDSAVQAVKDGGLLCITCTDMNVLCGNNVDTCHSKYGSIPLRGKHCHENALRIVLASVQSHANRYKRYIVPLLSVHIDFYVRIFVRVYTSPYEVKKSVSKVGYVYQCHGCGTYHCQPVGKFTETEKNIKVGGSFLPNIGSNCDQCERQFVMGGPVWLNPTYDPEFVKDLFKHISEADVSTYGAKARIVALLSLVSSELPDSPLFMSLSQMCNVLHVTPPSMKAARSCLLNAGYKVSSSHTDPLALKTDAPISVLWDILRVWSKTHPGKAQSPTSPAFAILSKEPKFTPDFTLREEASADKKTPRFLPNPKEGWGPMARAKPNFQKKSKKKGAQNNAETTEDPTEQLPTESQPTSGDHVETAASSKRIRSPSSIDLETDVPSPSPKIPKSDPHSS